MAAASGLRGGAATVSLAVVKKAAWPRRASESLEAIQQLLDVKTSPVVALVPSGYLIARSVYHWPEP